MYIDDLINQLQKARKAIWEEAEVFLYVDDVELEIFGVFIKYVEDGHYEVVIE